MHLYLYAQRSCLGMKFRKLEIKYKWRYRLYKFNFAKPKSEGDQAKA